MKNFKEQTSSSGKPVLLDLNKVESVVKLEDGLLEVYLGNGVSHLIKSDYTSFTDLVLKQG